MAIELTPSDPDFPFDLSRMYMALVVPATYPTLRASDPILEVQIANKEIPIGVKRNIEVGFAKHVRGTALAAIEAGKPEDIPSLEDYVDWLDHNLELLMQQKPAPTIKFTTYSGPSRPSMLKGVEDTAVNSHTSNREDDLSPTHVPSTLINNPHTTSALRPPVSRPVRRPQNDAPSSVAPAVVTSGAENPRRSNELRQLERRFRGNYAVLSDAPGGETIVRLDITLTDPDMQPLDIFHITSTVKVARSYPASPTTSAGAFRLPAMSLELDKDLILGRKGKPSRWQPAEGRQRYLDFVCRRFGEHVLESPETTLLHHLNWLDRWLFSMLSTPPPEQQTPTTCAQEQPQALGTPVPLPALPKASPRLFDDPESTKSWVRTISIDEADLPAGMADLELTADASGSESAVSNLEEYQEDNAGEAGEFSKPARRGTEIRFVTVNLVGVSLAHCTLLNLAVRCARCKNMVELRGILPTMQNGKDNQLWKACDSCSTILGVRFRPDWIVADISTLGFLDCSGCAPTDLLPSKISLSCETCAMADDDGGGGDPTPPKKLEDVVATVSMGSATSLNCRTCHARMSVSLQEPQFVRLVSGVPLGGDASTAQISKEVDRLRKTKVNRREELARLGVVPGQPLPDHGACKHFRKSTRWLRFPCCSKAYPCVTCHDEKEDHEHEFAQVMLCGHCAKEQRIAKVEQSGLCIGCGAQVIKKVDGNHAFWQGGMGVRDRVRMSRKDTRKFQGIGKTVAQKNVATPKKQT
ncbi:hypothetical protein H4R26_004458 [Coemansia thaxteri]|uniref:CHY-type domain-containing protein n=1 Tax=Coemansia thaxteri TaxID=2663907 RepID=A0A9W8BHA3_9FUNG|nr:hypothetical protein H4R26_004458 [Coemansia thaxteri]